MRKIEIQAALELSNQHIAIFKRILNNPEVSQDFKALLLFCETQLAERRVAPTLMNRLMNRQVAPASDEASRFLSEIEKLSKKDRAFETDLRSFFETGIFAMTLRWPETRGNYVRVAVEIEKEPQSEIPRALALFSPNATTAPAPSRPQLISAA